MKNYIFSIGDESKLQKIKYLFVLKLVLVVLLLSLFQTQASAQQKTVTGTVTEQSGETLIGVSVRVKDKTIGATTNENGKFSISAQEGDVLVFSYIGFQPHEERYSGNGSVDVVLLADMNSIEEVVVVGYGTQKKINLTGAVDQVSGDVLNERPIPNVSQGLVGVIPNLNIKMGDGKPTQAPSYNIRGTTSIGQGGSALVLIDGVEGNPSLLNPHDIQSVTVLKDAASAAIYGARGAFGVVLITTKDPVKDKTTISYSNNFAIKTPTAVPDLISNGYEWAVGFNDAWSAWNDYSQTPQNVNKTMKFSQEYLEELKRRDNDPSLPKVEVGPNGEYVYYDNTDYYDLLYKKNTSAMEHNLSVAGSSEKASYYVTGRLYDQKGLFRYNSDDYKMYNFRGKGSIDPLSWLRIENNSEFSSMLYHTPLNVGEGGGIWRNIADEGHPMSSFLNPDGTLSYSAAYTVGDYYYGKNGIDMNRRVFRNTTGLKSKFFENTFRVNADFTFQNTDYDEKRLRVPVPYSRIPGVIEHVGTNTNDIQNINTQTQYLAANLYSEYENTFNEQHYFKALGGFNYEQSTYHRLLNSRNGLIYEDASDINLALGQSIVTAGGYEQWNIMGGFFRLNYGFRDKYLFEVNGRYDGSSKFPEDQRYAFFPSVSAGWRIDQENFWNVSPNAISNLKLRASYGSLGNGNIGSYVFQEQFGISQIGRIVGGIRPQYTKMPNVIPAGLTWETSTTLNLGLDLSALSSRLNFAGDVYQRNTTDMFTIGKELPAVFGTSVPKGNYADLETVGWEASITWRDKFEVGSKPFTYNIGVSMADSKSKITKFNNDEKRLNDYYVGQTVGEIWGYTTDGFFTSMEDIANSADQRLIKSSNSGQLLPGDIKFADINGDGVINNGLNTVDNPGDMKIIGNSRPRYSYGINLGADWNNFSVSSFFQGIIQQDWWPGAEASTFWGQYNRPYNDFPSWQRGNQWSEDNPTAYLPRLRGYTAQGNGRSLTSVQTKYLQNIAYIRLKNLQVSYTLPASLLQNTKISSARIYFAGENLWSWSPLYKITKDIDVESTGGSDSVLTSGTSGNALNYPMMKSFSLGLSISF